MEKVWSVDFLLMGIQGWKGSVACSLLLQPNKWWLHFWKKIFEKTFAFGGEQTGVLNTTDWQLLSNLHLILKWIIIKTHYRNPALGGRLVQEEPLSLSGRSAGALLLLLVPGHKAMLTQNRWQRCGGRGRKVSARGEDENSVVPCEQQLLTITLQLQRRVQGSTREEFYTSLTSLCVTSLCPGVVNEANQVPVRWAANQWDRHAGTGNPQHETEERALGLLQGRVCPEIRV